MQGIYSSYEHQSKNFKPERLKHYKLCIFLGKGLLIYSVLSEQGKILLVKEYRSQEAMEITDFFSKIFEKDYFLKEDFAEVKIITASPEFSLVPRKFFAVGKVDSFASRLFSQEFGGDNLAWKDIVGSNATAVYTLPNPLKKELELHYKDPEYAPYCQPAIGMGYELSNENRNLILVHFFADFFVITGIREGSLQICNAYQYQSVSDIVYFVQLVQDLLKLEEGRFCEIFLAGEFESESELIRQLRKFIPHLRIPGEDLLHIFDTREETVPTWKYAFLTY